MSLADIKNWKRRRRRRKPKMHIKMGAEARPFFSPRLRKNEAARGRGTRTRGIHLPVLSWLLLLLLGDFRKKKSDAIIIKKKREKRLAELVI
jgi:hypothetical protein